MNEDDVEKILAAFSLLISAILYKGEKFSEISGKSELIWAYLSGSRDLKEEDYNELDEN